MKTVIEMAREAGFLGLMTEVKMLEAFAALVREDERDQWEGKFNKLYALMKIRESQPSKPCCLAEREACAKVCEDLNAFYDDYTIAMQQAAAAIRARGSSD